MTSRPTNYLVAVLSDRHDAESAYRTLQRAELPLEDLSILGEGYRSADDYGLIHPDREADRQRDRLALWLLPFGFVSGFLFNWLTGIELVPALGAFGNHILGGLIATAAAALGASLTGKLTGWTVGSGDAIAYRNRLNAGKYLLIAKGPATFVREATKLLRPYEPENLQGYAEQPS